MKKKCEICGEYFYRRPSKLGKYCSRKCYSIAKKGCTPWNKGVHTGHSPWLGKKRSKETIEKIKKTKRENSFNHLEESKKKIKEALRNDKSPNWKGENARYSAKHCWVIKHKGKAKECVECGRTNKETRIHWSNVDHKYKRNLNDYIARCPKCHKKYDLENGLCNH